MENNIITKEQLGPYKTIVEWNAYATDEQVVVATEILIALSKMVDEHADVKLTCVEKITFERI